MITKEAKLAKDLFLKTVDCVEIRDGVGEGILEAGQNDEQVVVLTADLRESTRVNLFAETFPDRFFDCGVAEQGMVTVASGLASYGKIPFITTYAIFSPGRTWEQIRTLVCLNDVPVKIIGSHAGFSAGLDGGNHQGLEDLAMMRALPNMVVVSPADALEAKKAVVAAAKTRKPTYIRSFKGEIPVITTFDTPFKIGDAETYWEGKNPMVGIIACGPQVYESLLAAHDLEKKGIETIVINSHTIKPLDKNAVLRCAKICGALVTVEEHQIAGGLGSAVSEVISQNFPVPMEMVGVADTFGETGKPEELRKKYGLTADGIIEAVKRVMVRKEEVD
jgi:transketolase